MRLLQSCVILTVLAGCGGSVPDPVGEPRPASVVLPRLTRSGAVGIVAVDAPDRVVSLAWAADGTASVLSPQGTLDAWADAVPAIETVTSCAGDLDALGTHPALCVFVEPGSSLVIDVTAAPEVDDDEVAWSDLDAFESSCVATADPRTVRCTVDADGQRTSPLATLTPSGSTTTEPPGQQCPSTLFPSSPIQDAAAWGDKLVLVGRFDNLVRRFAGPVRFDGDELTACMPGPTAGQAGVFDLVEHPDGGYLAAGRFTAYDGVDCPGVVWILDDGTVDADFCADLPAEVDGGRIAVDGRTLYVVRDRAIAVDLDTLAAVATSDPLTFAPYGRARDIAVADGTLFVVGELTQVGADPVAGLAALDAADLSRQPFAPTFDGEPRTVEVAHDRLWVGGAFVTVDDETRIGVAAFDLPGRTLTPFSLALGSPTTASVADIEPTADGVWIAGEFAMVGAAPRPGHARLATDGTLRSDVFPVSNQEAANQLVAIEQIVERDGVVTLAGFFDHVGNTEQARLAAFRRSDSVSVPVTGTSTTPRLLALQDEVWLDGSLGVQRQSAQFFGVYDPATGEVDDLGLDVEQPPQGVRVDGDVAYLWGQFLFVQGTARPGFAAIDLRTRQLRPWSLFYNGGIADVAFGPDRIYVGGTFGAVQGIDVGALAVLDKTNGALLPGPAIVGRVAAIADLGHAIAAGGAIETHGGIERGNLVWFDAADATPIARSAALEGPVEAMAVAGDELFVYSRTPAAVSGLALDDGLFAVDAATGDLRDWQPGLTSGAVDVIQPVGDTLLIGGSPFTIGGRTAPVMALDIVTAEIVDWPQPATFDVVALVPLGDDVAVVRTYGVEITTAP